jgi:CRP/FNR family cyclic AMP-dependent transcriptional regulator
MSETSGDIGTVSFQPGDMLFVENESSFHFYIIQEGEVKVYKNGPDGKPLHLAKLGPGNSLGEFAMLDRLPRSASARALTPVVAARISAEAYQQLLNDLPDWAMAVMKALVERLRHTNEVLRKAKAGQDLSKEAESAEFSDISTISYHPGFFEDDASGSFSKPVDLSESTPKPGKKS